MMVALTEGISAKIVALGGLPLKLTTTNLYTCADSWKVVMIVLKTYDGKKVYMNGKYPAVYVDEKNQHVHRLEWMKHFGEIPSGYIIHHKDEDKTNWSIDNLELLTRSEHVLQHQHSLHTDNFVKCGEKSRHHKLTQAEVDYIRSHYIKYDHEFGGRSLAKQFGVTEQCVHMIIKGLNWKVVM